MNYQIFRQLFLPSDVFFLFFPVWDEKIHINVDCRDEKKAVPLHSNQKQKLFINIYIIRYKDL